MKTYSIGQDHLGVVNGIRKGINLTSNRYVKLGLGRGSKTVELFKKNPPKTESRRVNTAYPVQVRGGVVLAQPDHHHENDQGIMVHVCTHSSRNEDETQVVGKWWFNNLATPDQMERVLVRGTGPKVVGAFAEEKDSLRAPGWHDALIIMYPGDSITVQDKNDLRITAVYRSVTDGLVRQS